MIISKKILMPRRIVPGDMVGIAAPASSFDMKSFHRGVDVLKSMGFQIYVPDDLFERKGYLAGSDTHRARLVNRLFADRNIKAIVCARGGFGSIRMLSSLNFGTIRENPKIFVGFSDISAILCVLYAKCDLTTFHGPVVTTLGDADQQTRNALLSVFSSRKPFDMILENGVTIKGGYAWGPVLGGNLATLCHLMGTPFQPDFKGHILFLEDRGEPSYRIDRMLTHMKLARCFDGLSGLVLGSFEGCGPIDEIFRIVRNVFKRDEIPILAGLDAGHGTPNLTLPMGLDARLDADNHLIRFKG